MGYNNIKNNNKKTSGVLKNDIFNVVSLLLCLFYDVFLLLYLDMGIKNNNNIIFFWEKKWVFWGVSKDEKWFKNL